MIKTTTIMLAAALTLGGCHIFKDKPPVTARTDPAQSSASRPAATSERLSLESLDARVTAIEGRNGRVDARARAAKERARSPVRLEQ